MGHIDLKPVLKVLIYCEEMNDKRKFASLRALVLMIQVFSNIALILWVCGN
jgi:hypothetical protein